MPFTNTTLVCESLRSIHTKGIFHGEDPLDFAGPLFILQLTVICITLRITYLIFRPFGQPAIISQIIGGILIGPSGLCRDKYIANKLFPQEAKLIFDTVAWFGLMIFIFLYGVKMDLMTVKQTGRRAMVFGFSSVLFPMILCLIIAFVIRGNIPSDSHLVHSLPYIAISQSLLPFIVITCVLTEIKTLNSDLGRLAVSSSVYADLTGIAAAMIAYNLATTEGGSVLIALWTFLSAIVMVVFTFLVLRPAMNWLSRQFPEGKPLKGNHFVAVLWLMLVLGFISLMNGQNVVVGPLAFGLVVPKGPPLGSALDEKLDTMVTTVFLPAFFLMCGLHTDISTIHPMVAGVVGLIALVGFLGKMIPVLFSSVYYNIPFRDAVVVGLMLNSRGIAELFNYKILNEAKVLDDQEYALCVISILLITGITTPILIFLHDPSQSYTPTNRRTIQDTKRNSELRMLVCIRKQENVPTMINLIEVSHANKDNPIAVIVLKLVELVGRASPIIVSHNEEITEPSTGRSNNNNTTTTTTTTSISTNSAFSSRSDQMIFNAFHQYKLMNEESVNIQQYTAISHVATIHDDVCQVACDKRATIIIVPFHKEWAIDGSISSVDYGLRAMNRNVLKKAPCSVGILVDRGIVMQAGYLSIVTNRVSFYRVAVILIGGPDDDEALAYGARIALHENVKVTVIFLNDVHMTKKKVVDVQVSDRQRFINDYNDRMEYREEMVPDGEKLASLIREILEEGNDLAIVGRRQGRDSPLFSGLLQWNECPELGVIGDMLASPDFGTTSSILVVQQQRQLGNQPRSSRESFDLVNCGSRAGSHVIDYSVHDVPMDENEGRKMSPDKMC